MAQQELNAEQGVGQSQIAGTNDITGALNENRTLYGNTNQNIQNNITGATGAANSTLQQLLNGFQGSNASAIASGQQGNEALQKYAASNPQFTAPTAAEVEQTPGYQFQLQQGLNGITNQAAAQGLSQSGSTLAGLENYAQGLAGTYYQNAFNNALQGFQTNQNTTLNNLQALIGSGATANAQNLSALQSFGGQQAQNTVNAGNTLSQLQSGLTTSQAGQNLAGNEDLANFLLQGATTQGNFATGYGEAQQAQQLANSGALGNLIKGATLGFL